MRRTFLITGLSIASLAFAVALLLILSQGPAFAMQASPEAAPEASPRLAVAHLAPFAADPNTAVTVTLNSTPVLTDFMFTESTPYLSVEAGEYLVEVFVPGVPDAVISATVNLTDDTDYTAIATGGANGWPLELQLLVDDSMPTTDTAKVRIGHLAPFATLITDTLADVRLQDGTVILDDVPFGAVADYIELPGGEYDLKITTADGSATLIDPMPVEFNNGDILSVFAVGDGANQPVGAFALPSDVEGFLLPLAASLQIAHLAPFAADPGTAVTVTLDSTAVLTDFMFADSTPYLPIEAGTDHLVEIFPGGAVTPAITATINLTQGMGYSAIAYGGANSWPLGLLLLQDDTVPMTDTAKVRIGHLAPFAELITDTLADVRFQNGDIILDDVPFGAVADYLELPAGVYDLKITTADGSVMLIDPLAVSLGGGDILSVYAVGDLTNQPVGAFALPSGVEGFLLPLSNHQIYLPIVMR
jgi:hypothetical protein